jgi:hypothetical protein
MMTQKPAETIRGISLSFRMDPPAPYPPQPGPKIDLRDPHAVRRELAAVYRDARAGHLDASAATRLGYLLSLLLRAFETTELQDWS